MRRACSCLNSTERDEFLRDLKISAAVPRHTTSATSTAAITPMGAPTPPGSSSAVELADEGALVWTPDSGASAEVGVIVNVVNVGTAVLDGDKDGILVGAAALVGARVCEEGDTVVVPTADGDRVIDGTPPVDTVGESEVGRVEGMIGESVGRVVASSVGGRGVGCVVGDCIGVGVGMKVGT